MVPSTSYYTTKNTGYESDENYLSAEGIRMIFDIVVLNSVKKCVVTYVILKDNVSMTGNE